MAAKKHEVRMLTSMAGANFSHAPKDIVKVTLPIKRAWIRGGIAEAVAPDDVKKNDFEALQRLNARLEKAAEDAQSVAETAIADKDEVQAELEGALTWDAALLASYEKLASKVEHLEATLQALEDAAEDAADEAAGDETDGE